MTSLRKTAFGAVLGGAVIGTGALAFSAVSGLAAVVCSGNVWRHTPETYSYPPEAAVMVHPDEWRGGPSKHFTWREHEGRGRRHGDGHAAETNNNVVRMSALGSGYAAAASLPLARAAAGKTLAIEIETEASTRTELIQSEGVPLYRKLY